MIGFQFLTENAVWPAFLTNFNRKLIELLILPFVYVSETLTAEKKKRRTKHWKLGKLGTRKTNGLAQNGKLNSSLRTGRTNRKMGRRWWLLVKKNTKNTSWSRVIKELGVSLECWKKCSRIQRLYSKLRRQNSKITFRIRRMCFTFPQGNKQKPWLLAHPTKARLPFPFRFGLLFPIFISQTPISGWN